FALQPVANQYDLSVNIIPLTPVRPGMVTRYRLEYRNTGTMVATNAKLKFIKSGKTIITGATPAYAGISGDTLTWNLNTLNPAAFGAIEIQSLVAVPPIANFADSMYSKVIITQSDTDVRPFNDTVKLRQLITGSYDPNDKIETHGGYMSRAQVNNGEYLNYIIRFQNTGNDTAFKVLIRDTLENNLDAASLQMIGSSHDYTLQITDNNKLEWNFENILLADSNTNEKASHGYLVFRIKPQAFVTNGTVISNRSDIYFDLNLPVRTKTVQTLIRDLPQAPPKPSLAIDSAYCGAIVQQKIKVNNPGNYFKAKVIVGTASLPVSPDSVFNISPKLIPPGSYTVLVQYINESGESWLIVPVKITSPVTPEVGLTSGTTTISSLSEVAMLTATNKKSGGPAPRYTFATDRNFTNILQAESASATYVLTADKLVNGSNWIYVRMKTSEACYTAVNAIDSIKITKSLMTTSVTDVDNPGVTIAGYPNPFISDFTLKGLLASKTYSVIIYDARGVVINSYKFSNKTIHTLNTSQLGTGTYWISIRDAKKNKLIGTLKAVRS
ncbi:T9SS type A sorting domain-containing protein, partial [Flavitalea sp.]|nr:T9SS type A sorting domain-containing protein [Flavitalea sp.]